MSGTVPWRVAFPAMAGVHMLIGVGEALITALVLVAVGQSHPELIYAPRQSAEERTSYGTLLGYGLVAAAGLALFLSPFASKLPDGLDRVAETHGFAGGGAPLLGRAHAAGELSAARRVLASLGHGVRRAAGHGGGVFPGALGRALVDPDARNTPRLPSRQI